jgi:hypothetical protein
MIFIILIIGDLIELKLKSNIKVCYNQIMWLIIEKSVKLLALRKERYKIC